MAEARLQVAREFLADAKLCLDNGRFRSAVSRAYYGAFHACVALAELQERFPTAEFLLNDEVYGEEDLYIDIYVGEDELLVLDRFANELTCRYWERTGYDILPMVALRECYQIKE